MFFDDSLKVAKVEFRTTEKNKDKLKKLAKSEGLNLSQFILKCIDLYLKHGFTN